MATGPKLVVEYKGVDHLTGVTRSMRVEMNSLGQAAKKATKELMDNAAGMDKLARSTREAGESMHRAGGHSEGLFTKLEMGFRTAERVVGAVESVAEAAFSLGESAIHVAAWQESTDISLKTVLGSGEAAKEMFNDIIDLSSRLPIQAKEGVDIATKFAVAGYDKDSIKRLLIASTDVKSFAGEHGQEMFVSQLAEVQQVGLMGRHLNALSMQTMIPEEAILKNIAKAYKLDTEKNWQQTQKTLKKAMEERIIDKTTAVNAILQALADKEGGLLGPISKEKSFSVEGIFEHLQGLPTVLLKDLNTSPAYGEFRHFLQLLADETSPNSAFGAKLKGEMADAFGRTFTRLFGDFSGPDGTQKMEEGLVKVLHVAQELEVGLEGVVASGRGFAKALGESVGSGGDLFGPDGKLNPKRVKELTDGFERFGHTVGSLAGNLAKLVSPLERVGTLMDFFGSDAKGAEMRKLTWEGVKDAAKNPGQFAEFLSPAAERNTFLDSLLGSDGVPPVSPMSRIAPSSSTTRPAGARSYHVEQHQHFHGATTPEAAKEAGSRAREGVKAALDGHADESDG